MGMFDPPDVGMFAGYDPEAMLAARDSMAMSPAVMAHLQGVLNNMREQFGSTYDPNRSFADNARDPQALEQAMNLAMGFSGGGLGIKAYHGSPYDFERFDASKIGTGEGAQAYGHGLYFAENPETARWYRDAAVQDRQMPYVWRDRNGNQLDFDALASESALRANDPHALAASFMRQHPDVDAALTTAMNARPNEFVGGIPERAATIEGLMSLERRGVAKQPAGRMYEVDINAEPHQFLDWDKPLSGQPSAVQSAIGYRGEQPLPGIDQASAAIRAAREAGTPLSQYAPYQALQREYQQARQARDRTTYQDLGIREATGIDPAELQASAYHTGLTERFGNLPDASRYLQDRGIPGIRYLDQGSRGAGYGTSNYVVFDPSIVEILKKYGLAGLTTTAGAAAAPFGVPQQ